MDLLESILRAAAIPILALVGIGTVYIIRLMRQALADLEETTKENDQETGDNQP